MSNIQNWLAQIKSARYGKDVRESIYNSIFFLNNIASAAQNSASASATSAQASATSASSSASSAKASATLAEQYKNDAFAGTPEGYAELVEDVRLMDIQTTTEQTLANSKAGGYKLVSMSGNSVQNGTPSTDNKQAIHNTGDCVEMIQGYYKGDTGAYAYLTTAVCSKNQIPCSSGDVVKIALEKANSIRILCYTNGAFSNISYFDNVTETEYSIPSGVTSFAFFIGSADLTNLTPQTVGKITLTINGKYVVQIPIHGKNFLNVSITGEQFIGNFYVNSVDYNYKISSNSNYYAYRVSVDKATKYVFSIGASFIANVRFEDNEHVAVGGINYSDINNRVFAFSNDTIIKYLVFSFSTDLISTHNIQFEEGEVATDYEPYTESVATVLLNEPLRESDVMSRTEVNRKRASVVFDGSEDEGWTIETIGSYPRIFTNLLQSKLKKISASETANGLCTQYNILTANQTYLGSVGLSTDTVGTVRIYDTQFTTVDEWLEHLANTPMEFEYELAEEVIEELDTDSQIALNSLETFDTVTHIIVDSRTKPSEIKGEYGTSQVGAYTLKALLNSEINAIKIEDAINTMLLIGAE